MKRTLGVFSLAMLAGLSVLAPRPLSADTYAVRSADPENLELDWPTVLADVPEKYCFKVHCIVPADTAVVTDVLLALQKKQAVSLELLPDARKLFFQNGTWDADKGAFENVFPGMDEVDKGSPTAQAVIVYRAYPRQEWIEGLRPLGFTPINTVSSMGYLVYGPRAALASLQKGHPEIQAVLEVPAGIKRFHLDTLDAADSGGDLETTIHVAAPGQGAIEAILQTRNGASPTIAARANVTLTFVSPLSPSEARLLSLRPEVVAVSRSATPARPSDERSNVIIGGGFPDPPPNGPPSPSWPAALPLNNPASPFWGTFITSLYGRFPAINGVPGTEFNPFHQLIGFLDTGIDAGTTPTCPYFLRTPDGTCRVVFTADLTENSSNATLRANDNWNHGTMVASLAAGFAATNPRDSEEYSFTQGVCPSARVAMVKIFDFCTIVNGQQILYRRVPENNPARFDMRNPLPAVQYSLLSLASPTRLSSEPETSPGVTLFNHSWNTGSDWYADTSQLVDQATRSLGMVSFSGITPSSGPTHTPSLHVLAAGNYIVNPNDPLYLTRPVRAPGTAKNGITVGATQTYNRIAGPSGTVPDCGTFNTVDANSNPRIVSNFGAFGFPNLRLKPDLVAPAARAYGPTSSAFYTSPSGGCPDGCSVDITADNNRFTWSYGTSFSTPLVSGAAALTKEWLRWILAATGRPAEPSPALVKATLISAAKNLATCNPNCPECSGQSLDVGPGIDAWVRPAPDRFQGWGGLSLEPLFASTGAYYFNNQDTVLTANSGAWYFSLAVTDSSKPISVTVAWTDAYSEVTDAVQQNLKNDLDLYVYGYQPGELLPRWIWYGNYYYTSPTSCDRNGNSVRTNRPLNPVSDQKNNVERVTIPAIGIDRMKLVVLPSRIVADAVNVEAPGTWQQDFAVAVINAHPLY